MGSPGRLALARWLGGSEVGRSRSAARRREGEVELGRLVRRDGHAAAPDAELLVPRFDLVGSRRQARDRELAVGAGNGEVRVTENSDVGGHPAVDVALDEEHPFFLAELDVRLQAV